MNVTNPSDECVWTKPISWHSTDTERTKQEIHSHNLKWEYFCNN